ncbi:DegQ family serine endoprotease [Acetobacter oeni]|uniref:Probable periplasmic serine endoprotease DegP-like n=1 Tax=Acetobacter oeni TaxID=304077 RepID=A0A511XMB1_9PROT|nr:DegQ family serine endoprotease [Acetobacter oeni]MBB3884092.1 serine protease Do [Acetobacter oeni]NHO20097.1 Do family serine endopeptidase [Acetobacter oeni]GBR02537.1 endopeptidase DegP/Do [Acetobacter oeni LMG 21952]GEN64077.1 serine protease [Acetobacter oeni]
MRLPGFQAPRSVLALTLGVTSALWITAPFRVAPGLIPEARAAQDTPPAIATGAHGVPDSFADLADRLLPAVVNVSTTQTLKASSDDEDGEEEQGPQIPDFPRGSPFEKFFHDFMNRQNAPNSPPRKMQALGSGFIVSADGYIVTNNHVIRHADKITVTLQDNTTLPAKLIGHDDRTDLALLKVAAPQPLPFVTFGDSDTARVGNWVLAIGNPFGLSGTVTAGIVSSRSRNIDQGPYDDFIQTDASINKGNSGGPLFDMHGAVIGVNTAIYSPSGGSVGIGFSIPSNEAKGIIEQLRKTGKVSRGWIGVRIQDVTQEIADGLNLKPARGALLAGVEPKGPAAKAQLATGDVIQQLNGKTIEGRALPRLIADLPVGSQAHLTVWRKGKTIDVPVTIGTLPETDTDSGSDEKPKKPGAPKQDKTLDLGALGFSAGAITEDTRKQYQLSDSQKGVVVTGVTDGGPASERGLKPGDVVTEVQQTAVNSPAELRKGIEAAQKEKRRSVLLLVHDSDGLRWVPFPLDGNAR